MHYVCHGRWYQLTCTSERQLSTGTSHCCQKLVSVTSALVMSAGRLFHKVGAANVGATHCCLHVLAIVLLNLRLDLSAVEYDDEILDSSLADSVTTALVYAACCAGVIFIHLANETKFGRFNYVNMLINFILHISISSATSLGNVSDDTNSFLSTVSQSLWSSTFDGGRTMMSA